MKPSLQSIMRAAAAASLLGLLAFTPVRAADEPKAAPTPEEAQIKRVKEAVQRLEAVLNELEAKGAITSRQRAQIEKNHGVGGIGETPVAPSPGSKDPFGKKGFKLVPPAPKPGSTNAGNPSNATTAEVDSFNYKSVRTSVYEGERRSAEKIKAHIRAADARAMLLLEGSAPSHVLGR
jgi:hypothetical protein